MKKFIVCSCAVLSILFAACDKKGNTYEFAQILYPDYSGGLVYADQTQDSLKFATTYDWSLSYTEDWLSISPDSMSGTVPDGYYMINKVKVHFNVNNTDTVRVAVVNFNADGKTLSSFYQQVHYLNIQNPVRKNYQFLLTDSATQLKDSIVFRTYGSWTLTFDEAQPEWISWKEGTSLSGNPGKHILFYNLTNNTGENDREAVLSLQSNGVTTKIKVKQEAQEK